MTVPSAFHWRLTKVSLFNQKLWFRACSNRKKQQEMLCLLALAFACLCEKLGLPTTSCVNDTLIMSSSYDLCTYTQASIDCGLMTCAEAMNGYCTITCECAPGCTMDMLAGGGTSYCNPACDNDVCNHCRYAERRELELCK